VGEGERQVGFHSVWDFRVVGIPGNGMWGWPVCGCSYRDVEIIRKMANLPPRAIREDWTYSIKLHTGGAQLLQPVPL